MLVPAEPHKGFGDIAQADSLIQQELSLFNISPDHIRTDRFMVNDAFTRKRYIIDLPPQISKTHLHAELGEELRRWKIDTVGFVDVPEDEMTIHLLYGEKIIRSLHLRTNPELLRISHPAELWLYFDQQPATSLTDRIQNLSVPKGVVLRSASERSLVRWAEVISGVYSNWWIWYDDTPDFSGQSRLDNPDMIRAIRSVSQVSQTPHLLVFGEFASEAGELPDDLEINVTDGSEMMILSSENRFEFDQAMLTYSRIARQAGRPQVLVRVTNQTIEWLEEWIPRIRRGGVVFVGPQPNGS